MICCMNDTEMVGMVKKAYEYDNSYLVEEFIDYPTYGAACDDYPWIDDIITGVSLLDLGGNTRPISKNVLYVLMSTQPTITKNLIKEVTGKSDSHAQKLTAMVRTACRAIEKELRIRQAVNSIGLKWK